MDSGTSCASRRSDDPVAGRVGKTTQTAALYRKWTCCVGQSLISTSSDEFLSTFSIQPIYRVHALEDVAALLCWVIDDVSVDSEMLG